MNRLNLCALRANAVLKSNEAVPIATVAVVCPIVTPTLGVGVTTAAALAFELVAGAGTDSTERCTALKEQLKKVLEKVRHPSHTPVVVALRFYQRKRLTTCLRSSSTPSTATAGKRTSAK